MGWSMLKSLSTTKCILSINGAPTEGTMYESVKDGEMVFITPSIAGVFAHHLTATCGSNASGRAGTRSAAPAQVHSVGPHPMEQEHQGRTVCDQSGAFGRQESTADDD